MVSAATEIEGVKMQFIVGVVLFVVVAGVIDRRLPWPAAAVQEVAR